MVNRYALLLLMCAMVTAGVAADSFDWQLKRDRDGIKIYTRKVEGSPYRAVRGVAILENMRISSLVALVLDADACPRWGDRCARSYVFEQQTDTSALVYTLNDMPWPVADRDVLAQVNWSQDPATLAVEMQSSATADILDKKKGVVRLTHADARWLFTPLGNGRVEVVTEAHLNPGGPLPGWVTNMLLVEAPFKTLVNMRQLVRDEKYRQAEIGFVREPEPAGQPQK